MRTGSGVRLLATAAAAHVLVVTGAVITKDFVCEVPADYTNAELQFLADKNCHKVSKAIESVHFAVVDGMDLSFVQRDAWLKKAGRAHEICQEVVNNTNTKEAAFFAINAWGTVMVSGKECCTLLGPPYCFARDISVPFVAGLAPFALLAALFVLAILSSLLCLPKRNARRPAEDKEPPADLASISVEGMPPTTDSVRTLLSRLARLVGAECASPFQRELEDRWMKESCLRMLKGADNAASVSAALFASLQETFDFQPDSVRNQFEHLVSLWRSQCSMVADRDVGQGREVNADVLLGTALGDLHSELLDGFLKWRAKLAACPKAAVPSRDESDLHMLGGARRGKLVGLEDATAEVTDSDAWLSACLEEVATFLLVWGEAGNVRFMPEVLYFITELALAAEKVPYSSRDVSTTDRSHHFLSDVFRPIYNTIFNEWYDCVTVNEAGKDAKKLHFGYDDFLPANVANYDDWNEMFCEPERLVEGILLADNTPLFDKPHKERFAALVEVNWAASLQAAATKTHREVHSLWGAFASTQRIWLVHSVLFLTGLVLTAGSPPQVEDRRLGEEAVLGHSLLMRLAVVSLALPCHAMLWWIARWQITGAALRASWSERCHAVRHFSLPRWCKKTKTWICVGMWQVSMGSFCKWLVSRPSGFVMFLPAVTYAVARVLDNGDMVTDGTELGILCAHFIISIYVLIHLLLVPCDDFKMWELSQVSFKARLLRYAFWTSIFAVKFVVGLIILSALHRAIDGLQMSRPGNHSLRELSVVFMTTDWWADMLIWFVMWSTTFILFNADTQLWFTLGCTVLGVADAVKQHSWVLSNAVSNIPSRFSKKILTYAQRPSRKNGKKKADFATVFPFLWDRIVAYMRYEDDIDTYTMADLSFDARSGRDAVRFKELGAPLRASAGMHAVDATGEASTALRVKLPAVFNRKNPSETCFKTYCCMPDPHEPSDSDIRWRISALGRGLSLPMPRPYRAPYIPGLTVLIPHYGEQILVQKKELLKPDRGSDVPLIHWLKQKYEKEFLSFTNRMKARSVNWPVAGDQWEEYSEEQWAKVVYWASMRLQTLFRTVAGMCYYYPALQCHYEAQGDRLSPLSGDGVWRPEEVFTCLVSMQMYQHFNKTQLEHTNIMFDKFPPCFKVAFINSKDKGPSADRDAVHESQARRYYSCLIDKRSPVDDEGRRTPHLSIELPGFPILGDGKGDNQNHAIPFMRGHFSQCIDANQGAYFEQMMMLPCALGEFRSHKRGDGLSKRIIGFPEHITSDIGSIGDFAASAEVAFGTILQRTYAVLGARMHYGHPDIMNKVYMMQQGGVSKATKSINLSEDIFAGMDFTLRGDGRQIRHREYFHLAKGRDMGFNAVLGFFSKLSSGTGEQLLSRQTFRLGQVLHLPEALGFYYAHAGYYINQFFVSISMPLLIFMWLLVLLSDCEERFLPFQSCSEDRRSSAELMAGFLFACFSWLVLLYLVANTMPLFCELWLQVNLKGSVQKFLTSIFTLSPLMFIFQAKTIGYYITNEIRFGGASYVATGRGLPTERRFIMGRNSKGDYEGLYLDYASIAYYDGVMLLAGVVMVHLAGGTTLPETAGSLFWTWLSAALTITSWLYAPCIFNPYNFSAKFFFADMRSFYDFFFRRSGKHWSTWYERALIKPRRGVHKSMQDVGFILAVLFLFAWYSLLNRKADALTTIFSEFQMPRLLYASILVPPFFSSLVYSTSVVVVETLWGCRGTAKAGLATAQGWARDAAARARRTAEAKLGRASAEVVEAAGERPSEDPQVGVASDGAAGQPSLERERSRVFEDGMPLAISGIVVTLLQLAEAGAALWYFRWIGWQKAFMAGLILKWGLTCMCLFLAESMLLSPSCISVVTLPLHHWVRSNRIARDMLVALVVVLPQIPMVLLTYLNDYICPGCSAHQLLIYRDPGTVEREEAVFDLDSPECAEAGKASVLAPEQVTLGTKIASSGSAPGASPRGSLPVSSWSAARTAAAGGASPPAPAGERVSSASLLTTGAFGSLFGAKKEG